MNNIIEDLQEITAKKYPNKTLDEQTSIAMLTLFKVFQLPYFKDRYHLYKIRSNHDNTLCTLGLEYLNDISCVTNHNLGASNITDASYFGYDLFEGVDFVHTHLSENDRSLLEKTKTAILKSNNFQELMIETDKLHKENEDYFYHLKYIRPQLKGESDYDHSNANADLMKIIVEYLSKDKYDEKKDPSPEKYKSKIYARHFSEFAKMGEKISILNNSIKEIKSMFLKTDDLNEFVSLYNNKQTNVKLNKSQKKDILKTIKDNQHPFLTKTLLASCLKFEDKEDRVVDIMSNGVWNKAKTESLIHIHNSLSVKHQEEIMENFNVEINETFSQLIKIKPQLINNNNNVTIDTHIIPKKVYDTVDIAGSEYIDFERSWDIDKGMKGFAYMKQEYFMQRHEYSDQIYFVAKNDLEILGYAHINQREGVCKLTSLDVMESERDNEKIYHQLLSKVYDYIESENDILNYSYGSHVQQEYLEIVPNHIKSFEAKRNSDVLTMHDSYGHGDKCDEYVRETMERNQSELLNSSSIQKNNIRKDIKKMKEKYLPMFSEDMDYSKKCIIRDEIRMNMDNIIKKSLKINSKRKVRP